MGSVTIAFDANNPGRWAFHCRNLYHMMTGVMTEVRYPGAPLPMTCHWVEVHLHVKALGFSR
jgi:hypothetical protein